MISKEAHTIFKHILSMLSYFLITQRVKLCLCHYQNYYNRVKKNFKSDYACLAINKIARSIETNMKYLCHYRFIDLIIFDFLGDSIIEGENCGLKRGDVTVSANINIDTSALT